MAYAGYPKKVWLGKVSRWTEEDAERAFLMACRHVDGDLFCFWVQALLRGGMAKSWPMAVGMAIRGAVPERVWKDQEASFNVGNRPL